MAYMLGQKMSQLLSEVQPLQKMSKLLSEVQAQLPNLTKPPKMSDLTLNSLPDEVLLEILERVPRVWLVASVSRVSMRLRRLARHRSLWIRVDLSNIAGQVQVKAQPVCTNTASWSTWIEVRRVPVRKVKEWKRYLTDIWHEDCTLQGSANPQTPGSVKMR